MGNGFWAGDAIASGMRAAADAQIGAREAQRNYDQVTRLVNQRDEMTKSNAANFSEKHALRVALAKLDPTHPLLTNKSLQERIQNAGERALVLADDWNAVKAAGASFKY